MKLLLLHKTGARSATFRQRLALYLPYLRDRGMDCTVSSLDDQGLFPWKRLSLLRRSKDFDLAVIYHEIFPHLPAAVESRLLSIPYVYDFDDAVHVLEGPLTSGKTSALIKGASAVIAGSGELEKYALERNRDVTLIPTVVDVSRYPFKQKERDASRPFTIGWIGTPETTPYLHLVAEALRKLSISRGARFIAVGAGPIDIPGVRFERRAWSEATEQQDLAEFDVGIMPLSDDQWSRGKCGFKLVQYMACGIPAVASPVGANKNIVLNGTTGILAAGTLEWVSALEQLADEPSHAFHLGSQARARAEAQFDLSATAPLFLQVLEQALRKSGRKPLQTKQIS